MVLGKRIFNMIYIEDTETQILIYGVSGLQKKKSKIEEIIIFIKAWL
jgi:hypothetical protein